MAQIGWKSGPRTVGDIVDGAIALYRHNFARLFGITAVVYVPFGIAQVLFTYCVSSTLPDPFGDTQPDPAAFPFPPEVVATGAAFMLLGTLALIVAQAALSWAISEVYLGNPVSTGGAYRYVLRRFWPLLLTTALATLVTGLSLTPGLAALPFGVTEPVFIAVGMGLLLLGSIPAIVFVVLFAFVVPVLVVEGRFYVAALTRSRQLVAGHFWRVVGTFLVLTLLVSAVSSALTVPSSVAALVVPAVTPIPWAVAQTAGQAMGAVATLLLTPVQLIGTILIYYDLRIRKEGFDLDRMAAELEAAG